LATGRVLQFDHGRGYGFVAAEDGGEDVFLHASVFDGDSDLLAPGTQVEFQVMSGDRGRKAFAAHLIRDGFNGDGHPDALESAVPAPAQPAEEIADPPTQAAAVLGDPAGVPDEEQLCDVLSSGELTHAVTEMLLETVPGLTGRQIRDVRQSLLEFARHHGWSDG
jgi:cold shock protein